MLNMSRTPCKLLDGGSSVSMQDHTTVLWMMSHLYEADISENVVIKSKYCVKIDVEQKMKVVVSNL